MLWRFSANNTHLYQAPCCIASALPAKLACPLATSCW